MGYINHYVEHQGQKVVILANEEEILAKQQNNDENKSDYKRIKEKLIGKTFEVVPDIDGAINHFITLVSDESVKNFYQQNIDEIIECFNCAKKQNLRHLKQALWDFERLEAAY